MMEPFDEEAGDAQDRVKTYDPNYWRSETGIWQMTQLVIFITYFN